MIPQGALPLAVSAQHRKTPTPRSPVGIHGGRIFPILQGKKPGRSAEGHMAQVAETEGQHGQRAVPLLTSW